MDRISIWTIVVAAFLFSNSHSSFAQNVIAWGNNDSGQTDVPADATNVIAVAAGWNHSLALRDDGTVISWGAITHVPTDATNVVAIAAGAQHNIILRANGTVWAWGTATSMQATNLGAFTGVAAIAASDFVSLLLHSNGTLFARGDTFSAPPNLGSVKAISAGTRHALITFSNGTVGSSLFWFPDLPFSNALRGPLLSFTNTLALYAGTTNNVALRADGTVKPWGWGRRQPVPPVSVTNVITLALSTNCNFALRSDGRIAAWGSGLATNVPASASNVIAVAAGRSHGLAIIGDGAPRFYAQPGHLDKVSVADRLPVAARVVGASPLHLQWLADGTPIPGATNAYPQIPAVIGTDNVAYQVVASNAFGSVTSAVSKVKVSAINVWGDNANKQRTIPLTLTNPVMIAAGVSHALGVNANGSVVAWGRNSFGQSTVPANTGAVVGIAAGSEHSLAVRSNGTVVAWGRNGDGQTNVPVGITNAVAVSAGRAHSLVLKADGNVVAWGNNEYHQTNVPPYVKDITAVAAGYDHNLALKWDGSVIAWGNNEGGLVPADATNIIAIAAGWEHNLALRADGRILAWGDNSYGQTDVPASATNIIALAAGYYHSLALRADGTVVGWGKGHLGVINIPGALKDVSAIAVGEDFSMALVKVGAPVFTPGSSTVTGRVNGRTLLTTSIGGTQPLSCQWFFNGTAITGATNHFLVLDPVQPSDAGTYTLVVTNALGETNTYVVHFTVNEAPHIVTPFRKHLVPPYTHFTLSAEVHALEPINAQWRRDGVDVENNERISGANNLSLQLNTTEFDDSGNYELVVSNAVGVITGAVARVNVTPVIAWGDNFSGQLDAPFGTTNIVAVSAGETHSIALTGEGKVIAWGANNYGQTTIPASATNIVAIAAGDYHNVAAKSDGTVIAWGDNRSGQCNISSTATNVLAVAANAHASFGLRSSGTAVSWPSFYVDSQATNLTSIDASRMGLIGLRANGTAYGRGSFSPIASWTNLVAVAAGLWFDFGLQADGKVLKLQYGWHDIDIPQMNTIGISAGNDHALTLDADGTVRGWGENNSGQIDVPEYLTQAIAISAGGAHSMALVNVSTNLHFVAEPQDQLATSGQSVTLEGTATGRGPVSYQWYLNDSLVYGATNSNHSFSAEANRAGEYKLVASNPWNSITSAVAIVSIPTAPSITLDPQSQAVLPGTTVLLTVQAQGTSPLTYQWRLEGGDLAGETNSLLQLSSVTAGHEGIYTVIVTNSFGFAISAPARLKVIVPSQLNLNFTEGSPFLSFAGNTGATYVIQYSTNLASSNWIDLITLSNPSGAFQFSDTNVSTNGSRFYRAVGN